MGFCLFNNVAVGAKYAQEKHGIQRVLIVDWDCHHGNGTQHIFDSDPSVFYFSTHQYPHYPGTGSELEKGKEEGTGTTLNVPLPYQSGDQSYLDAFQDLLVPAMVDYKPQLIMISAGFDAHEKDPLCGMNLTTEGFKGLTDIVCSIAEEHCGGKIVSLLEGGYNLDALAESVAEHIMAMLEPTI
jgi:acetoin utilization deacetylase AcuC-like enzyme